jgi:hypothetical protein
MLPGGEIPADNAKLNLVQIFDEVWQRDRRRKWRFSA